MKASNINTIDHDQSYITITITNEIYTEILKNQNKRNVLLLIQSFQQYLLFRIGAKTIIEYRVQPVSNNVIKFPIKIYTNKQRNKKPKALIMEKINDIQKYVSSVSPDSFTNRVMMLIRHIKILLSSFIKKFDIKKLFNISGYLNGKLIYTYYLKFNFPIPEEIHYKTDYLSDKSRISQFIDPYVEGYMVIVDYSKKMSELNYGFNYLHMFEHYVTYAWRDITDKTLIEYNGATYLNGLCYVYSADSDEATAKERALKSIEFHIKSSDVDFIKNTKALDTETIRTISEAYTMRNLTRSGRSDQAAFLNGYDPAVFAYWSSLPFNILIITNKDLKFNIDELNDLYTKYHKNQPKPQQTNLNYFPKEVLYTHYESQQHIYKADVKNIVSKIYNNKPHKAFYGIDNKLILYTNEQEYLKNPKVALEKGDLSDVQNVLSPLLFYVNCVDDDTLKKYISKNIFPLKAVEFDECPIINQSSYCVKTLSAKVDELE